LCHSLVQLEFLSAKNELLTLSLLIKTRVLVAIGTPLPIKTRVLVAIGTPLPIKTRVLVAAYDFATL